MSAARTLVRTLYSLPGSSPAGTEGWWKQAAFAHEHLFRDAADQASPELAQSLGPLVEFLDGQESPARERLLCHPLFLEGLHGLAPCCPTLRKWHDCVTASPTPVPEAGDDPAAPASLGHVAFVCRLQADDSLEGDHWLTTDVLGRVEFPFCDWNLTLYTDQQDRLGRQLVKLHLDGEQASWQLDATEPPFLILSYEDCLRLVLTNADPRQFQRLEFPNPHVKPRFQWACALGHGLIRYDPVGFLNFEAHAGLTGGLVQELLDAIRLNSPMIHGELSTLIHTIRGFEFPESTHGIVGSFSDPTLPGVMGINVPYTPEHEPRIDPLCFTWIGHELGHTKNYLSDNILYDRGQSLLRNAGERTSLIPRYGRSLTMRTLIQVPYVHLYEWALLMDFWQADFRGLPWPPSADVIAAGEDLVAEIVEAFALIEAEADLTALGRIALDHFRRQFIQMLARWYSLRPGGKARA